ncbi:MAG: choice-of-anchor D domain-containing protein [Propionibacteriales bacterium]|nr:choice-of-anchor D domain-containing protein [Propionibacteriales bacterium]
MSAPQPRSGRRARAVRRWRSGLVALTVALAAAVAVPNGPAVAATATLSPTSLSFGSVKVWTSKSLVETVTVNRGYRVSSVSHSPAGPFQATTASNCGAPSVTVSTKCTITEVFQPGAAVVSSSSLKIVVCPILAGACTTYPVPVTGTGVFPATFSLTSIAFGTHAAGVPQLKTLTVTPDAGRWVADAVPTGRVGYLSPFTVSGFGAGCYQVGPVRCALTLSYNGNDVGPQGDTLVVSVCREEGVCLDKSLPMTGTSTAPGSLSPTSLAFGTTIHVGATVSKVITLKILGDWHVGLLFGANTPYSLTPLSDCSGPGPQTCTFTASYRPVAVGATKASLSMDLCAPVPPWWSGSTACVGTNQVALSGTAVAPGSLNVTSLAMGTVRVGARATKYVAVRHDPGWYPSAGFSDPSGDFNAGECVTSASPCSLPVNFDPTRTGAQTGLLTVTLCNDELALCVDLPKVKVTGTGS